MVTTSHDPMTDRGRFEEAAFVAIDAELLGPAATAQR